MQPLKDTTDIEMSLLLEALYQKYGYDFRQYSEAHIRRRLLNRLALSGMGTLSEMQGRMLYDKEFAALLLQDLSITVTEMFRDANFYRSLRRNVVPLLKTYSFIKVWHAGCSTGQEVYSMAIVLREEGLHERTTLYATDFNQLALDQAREGIYSSEQIKEYTTNYQRSGGTESFSDYYRASYGMAIMDASLKSNIVWANHNLVTDSVFAEVHLIVCRNVLIYFNTDLQRKVQRLFSESLINGGVLCLGSKESLRFSSFASSYTEIDREQKIFKKKYRGE